MARISLRKQLEASEANHSEESSQDNSRLAKGQRAAVASRSFILTLDDLLGAELAVIRYCQRQRFGEEISALFSWKAIVSRQSSIHRLDPVLQDGLLRVGGRLSRGAMPEEAKHPLILSKDQHVSMLILKHVHQNLGHGGWAHTLSTVRRRFWITNADSAV